MTGLLSEIEARVASATEGPWEASEDGALTQVTRGGFRYIADSDGLFAPADAAFIAAARSDVPFLLAELSRVSREAEQAERDADEVARQRDDLYARLSRVRAAAESDADLAGLVAVRGLLLRETDAAPFPPGAMLGGGDPDYSPAYQDEYQRLWHEAAAERDALSREAAQLRKILREVRGVALNPAKPRNALDSIIHKADAALARGKEASDASA